MTKRRYCTIHCNTGLDLEGPIIGLCYHCGGGGLGMEYSTYNTVCTLFQSDGRTYCSTIFLAVYATKLVGNPFRLRRDEI